MFSHGTVVPYEGDVGDCGGHHGNAAWHRGKAGMELFPCDLTSVVLADADFHTSKIKRAGA